MARKKKGELPSGSVRVQRRWKDEFGKSHTKSFTASSRKEAEALATEWEHNRSQLKTNLSVEEAVRRYIEIKEGVLSPSTIRGYMVHLRQHLTGIAGKDLLTIRNADLQVWVSDLTGKGLSPKTIRNAYGLVTSAIGMFLPDLAFRCTLPQKQRPELYCPSQEDVRAVIDAADNLQVKAAIMLAAYGTMRRGEILALRWGDIQGNVVRIRRAACVDDHGAWHTKDPKTSDSRRDVPMPEYVLDALRAFSDGFYAADEEIFTINPSTLRNGFTRAIRRAGVHPFRFHDLRHFSASQMHAMGIPDKYIEARGGWRPGSIVMKAVYQDVIDLEKAKQDRKILEIFSAQ